MRTAVLLLQESVLGGEAVQGVIDLADGADESGEGVCLEVAGVDPVGIDLTDVDLHRGVVLGGDDAAGRGASNFERKKIERIKIHGVPSIHYEGKRKGQVTISWGCTGQPSFRQRSPL